MDKTTKIKKLVELNFKQGEKIKISPVGEFAGFDGRTYKCESSLILENIKKFVGVDLLLDIEHGYTQHRDKAAGWFDKNSLEVRKNGIYASLELTSLGKELVENKIYKYLSPVYILDANSNNREVLYIDSIALVNKPNVLEKELNKKGEKVDREKEENKKPEQDIKELNKRLDAQKEANEKLTQKVKDLTIDLAIEQNKILPKDREFCKELNEKQLATYIEKNNTQEFTQELNTKTKFKEENTKTSYLDVALKTVNKEN